MVCDSVIGFTDKVHFPEARQETTVNNLPQAWTASDVDSVQRILMASVALVGMPEEFWGKGIYKKLLIEKVVLLLPQGF